MLIVSAPLRMRTRRYGRSLSITTKCFLPALSSPPRATRATRWKVGCVVGCFAFRDLTNSDDLALTQEFLAQMLGVRRPSVSIVASLLQSAGFIRYSRGHIRIINPTALLESSCECYATVNEYYSTLSAGKALPRDNQQRGVVRLQTRN